MFLNITPSSFLRLKHVLIVFLVIFRFLIGEAFESGFVLNFKFNFKFFGVSRLNVLVNCSCKKEGEHRSHPLGRGYSPLYWSNYIDPQNTEPQNISDA